MRAGKTLQITAVSIHGEGHEDILNLRWQGPRSSGVTSTGALIRWLREDPENEAWVVHDGQQVAVEIVTPIGAPSYLRSRGDGAWGDHLLGLARF